MKLTTAVLAIALAIAVFTNAARAEDPASGSWDDGWAELDGYRWAGTRYGEERNGQAVMVFVAEPFSASKLVKLDKPSADPNDAVQALKLNLMRDFQTGIYDYNTMVSTWVRVDNLKPLKTSFTSAEWCGHVYEQLLYRRQGIAETVFSYFEGESGRDTLRYPRNGISEDNLFILLRGYRGAFLKPGEIRSFGFLPGAFYRRLMHRAAAWTTASVERLTATERVTVPAGTFTALVYVVRTGNGREGRFFVEREYPHRIIKWTWAAGSGSERKHWLGGTESGELTGSARLEYWRLHNNGDERYLGQLGLKPMPSSRAR